MMDVELGEDIMGLYVDIHSSGGYVCKCSFLPQHCSGCFHVVNNCNCRRRRPRPQNNKWFFHLPRHQHRRFSMGSCRCEESRWRCKFPFTVAVYFFHVNFSSTFLQIWYGMTGAASAGSKNCVLQQLQVMGKKRNYLVKKSCTIYLRLLTVQRVTGSWISGLPVPCSWWCVR